MPGYGPRPWGGPIPVPDAWAPACQPPDLPGTIVDVAVGEYHGHMGGPAGVAGDMWLRLVPIEVPAGTVSLRVVNRGVLDHEVLVLPLAGDTPVGARPVDSRGQVDESAAVLEVTTSCGEPADSAPSQEQQLEQQQEHGIAPGTAGWATGELTPGRYELVCNLPGHYPAGMYAELIVN